MADQSPKPLLSVHNLCKHFPVFSQGFFKRQIGLVKAADDITFDIMPGEALGLVGESGSGKTTTGRTILRAFEPTSGEVWLRVNGDTVNISNVPGKQLKRLRTYMQMIFQDPFSSLNPRMTVGDIVAEPLVIHRLAKKRERDDRVADMLVRVGLKPEHRTRYPHAFSGGQRQRIGIARALIMRPSLVVADEPVSALDVSVQAQVINLLRSLQEEFGLAYIFIAHDLSVVKHICDRVAVMYAGKIVEFAETGRLFANAMHPYTQALLSAVPDPDPDVKLAFAIPGEVADPGNLPPGCSFNPRCPNADEECRSIEPEMVEAEPNHYVRCFRVANR